MPARPFTALSAMGHDVSQHAVAMAAGPSQRALLRLDHHGRRLSRPERRRCQREEAEASGGGRPQLFGASRPHQRQQPAPVGALSLAHEDLDQLVIPPALTFPLPSRPTQLLP